MRISRSAPALLALSYLGFAQTRAPMRVDYSEAASTRWAGKPVIESRLLDDMETPSTWVLRGKGEMTFTRERVRDGVQSLRLRARAAGEGKTGGGRLYGYAAAARRFDGEDWSRFNRISFWVYPDLPGWRTVPLVVVLENSGARKLPGAGFRDGVHYLILENHKWNRVVWEIAELPRDKVTAVLIQYTMNGYQPGESETVTYDIDRLELERVEADHFEGWSVAPGRISFSHTGYALGAAKSAIASGLTARNFDLVDHATGEVVVSKPVEKIASPIGEFQVMDFSEVRRPGVYRVRAGGAGTRPFRIDADVWRGTIRKAVNFFYAERCGFEIPGSHDACHRDWQAEHAGRRIVVNGGWHDAGDLSQGPVNTSEAVYAMLSLAERLERQQADPELVGELLAEARWGLDWVLKTRFGDGYRARFSGMSVWTNGILGDFDDAVEPASNAPYENLLCAAAEALAARVLARQDALLAARSLKAAREDWQAALAAIESPERDHPGARGGRIDLVAAAAFASLDLYEATGEATYAAKAVEMGGQLMQMQERRFPPGWTVPLAGFFYASAARDRLLHYPHRGHEQMPVEALARLATLFPEHKDWMKWYSAVALHSEYYLKAMARFTQPYGMLPASVYSEEEHLQQPAEQRESYRKQVLNGFPVGKGYRLRAFPVWFRLRGNHGTVLSQTKALSAAAHLRGRLDLAGLAERQLEWVVGRNPFVQSTMTGEGYDYAPFYAYASGDMVGALPVGIKTDEDRDVPFWPVSNCYTYKEIWVHPVARWIYVMRDLAGPALVRGQVDAGHKGPVVFRDRKSGHEVQTDPDSATGTFQLRLPEGDYRVRCGGQERSLTALPAGTYTVDLCARAALDWSLSKEDGPGGRVILRAALKGAGAHRFAVRTENLTVDRPVRDVTLTPKTAQQLVWRGKVADAATPWFAVIVPDGEMAQRREVTGVVEKKGQIE